MGRPRSVPAAAAAAAGGARLIDYPPAHHCEQCATDLAKQRAQDALRVKLAARIERRAKLQKAWHELALKFLRPANS